MRPANCLGGEMGRCRRTAKGEGSCSVERMLRRGAGFWLNRSRFVYHVFVLLRVVSVGLEPLWVYSCIAQLQAWSHRLQCCHLG